MAVLAVTDDLIFSSKIEAAAAALSVPLRLVSKAKPLAEAIAGEPYRLAIVDLNLSGSDVIECVRDMRRRYPQMPILGFCSHAQVQLQSQAEAAGCTQVVSRSVFVGQLPQLLAGKPLQ